MMLNCTLSDHMQSTLRTLTQQIPPLAPIIHEKLLNILSRVLSGGPFRSPGSTDTSNIMNEAAAKEYRENTLFRDGSEVTENDLIIRALDMLISFDFKGYTLNELVQYCTITYIEHDDPKVRKSAALTSCILFQRDPICFQTSSNSLVAVGEVLEKLLTVAITDTVPDIRLEVLSSLGKNFDNQLSQPNNVRFLFVALNDEIFAIRQVAIVIIGRLAAINPAYIIPSLRKTLIQLLTTLEYSTVTRRKEESAKLLTSLVSSSDELSKSYVKPIMEILLPRATSETTNVAENIIKCLGELANVAGEQMLPYIPKLMPIILDTFQAQSSPFKRDAALKTLGQLASSSGYVIKPLLEYPQLLGILLGLLRSEQSQDVKRETVRVLGILGAVDPYKHREIEQSPSNKASVKSAEQSAPPIDILLIMQGMSPTTNEEYYPTVVITTLMNILKDSSLSSNHHAVIQAIMYIFKSLGLRCVSFLGQIIPGLLSVMKTCPLSMLDFYFQQLGVLVGIVKQHIRVFLPDIFDIAKEFFSTSNLQPTILSLFEAISKSLDGEFRIYLPILLPPLLGVIEHDKSPQRTNALKVLRSFVVFGANIQEYAHLVIPNIITLVETSPIQRHAIECIGCISKTVNISDFSSRIVQSLIRVLKSKITEAVKSAACNTLSLLLLNMNKEFLVYVPQISKVLQEQKIKANVYQQLVNKLLNDEPLPSNLILERSFFETDDVPIVQAEIPSKKLPVNQHVLKNAFEVSQRLTRDDWQEWIRRLSVELLKESPSHALRACAGLASQYTPLARDLFNTSFISCWCELYTPEQEQIIKSLEIALASPNNPPEIRQTILNLIEFTEHDANSEKGLNINITKLGNYALRSHAFAKALHYKELEFMQEANTNVIESLISINNNLGISDAAIGILLQSQQNTNLQLKETWYEKLHRWEEALRAYNDRAVNEPNSIEVLLGKLRCYHALAQWEQLTQLAQEKWTTSSSDLKRSIAPLAAAAAWGMGQWDKMDTYINVMKPDSPDRAFFQSILLVHRNNFEEGSKYIMQARDLLATEVTALASESYNRAYGVIVRIQMLAELEEIIKYKRLPSNSEDRLVIRKTWNSRLMGCQRNVEIWQRMLKIRLLVVNPKHDIEIWIKFANLCRKSNRMGMAEKALNSLIEPGHAEQQIAPRAPPQVFYAQLKYMWATGAKTEALSHLIDFTSQMSADLGLNSQDLVSQPLPSNGNDNVYTKLLARCFLKQGEWQVALQDDWRTTNSVSILQCYLLATHFDRNWYKAWHNWALANFEVISMYSNRSEFVSTTSAADAPAISSARASELVDGFPLELVQQHVVPAIKCFFHSIALSETNSLQDTLRLLTLWFKFGGIPEAAQAINEGFGMVKIDNWLEVIPQLISQIHQPNPTVGRALHSLLADIGKAHPQALVYPLAVAIKSDSVTRQRAALNIVEKMRVHSQVLVDQAELVSHELIRVAVTWHELWHEGLEDASRVFFAEHNVDQMFKILDPLHKLLERGPETMNETSFQIAYGRELHNAKEWTQNYKRTQDSGSLNQAWDIYYTLFRKISHQLLQILTLDLQSFSPKLLAVKELELAIPGTYVPGQPIIKIHKFDPTLSVISSKQRPRKLSVAASNGVTYFFVLKGKEDLRQDSIAIQVMQLVNSILLRQQECLKRHLDIQTFPVIPLSPKSGLIGWVPNSDTFHVLIREYRESRKILLNIEHRIMLQMSPNFDVLTLLQKVEVFTYALDNTRGQDLQKILWLKSKSSESWLDRRTNYTRSLAVMSMVGYILGLGDRHPSNLMLDRITGKVIHIDFGDCFEAAILREKYPEKVPFRLTRMLTYAMEVSGIEGSFRITCVNVMKVLRDNKESLMAILEAFAYDPLINWSLDIPNTLLEKYYHNENQKPTDVEIRDARAALVLKRINDKLTGNDFKRFRDLVVGAQVDKLIQQATSVENLCQHYVGWCSFW